MRKFITFLLILIISVAVAEEPYVLESECVTIKAIEDVELDMEPELEVEVPIEEEIEEMEVPLEEEEPPTPRDNHYVELVVIKDPTYIGDTVILALILVDYAPGHIEYINWEWTEDQENWYEVPDEHNQKYEFVVTEENLHYAYRGVVAYRYESDEDGTSNADPI